MDRVLTKQAKVQTTIRLRKPDAETILEAARITGESRSEFLRKSTVERARRIIRRAQNEHEPQG